MPRGDGTGPRGQGPRTGRQGRGNIRSRMAGGAGPGGQCICPSCATVTTHEPGIPCTDIKCPQCGSLMIRK